MRVPTIVCARVNLPRALTSLAVSVAVVVAVAVLAVRVASASSVGGLDTLALGVNVRLYTLAMVSESTLGELASCAAASNIGPEIEYFL